MDGHTAWHVLGRIEASNANHGQPAILELGKTARGELLLRPPKVCGSRPLLDEGDLADLAAVDQALFALELQECGDREDLDLARSRQSIPLSERVGRDQVREFRSVERNRARETDARLRNHVADGCKHRHPAVLELCLAEPGQLILVIGCNSKRVPNGLDARLDAVAIHIRESHRRTGSAEMRWLGGEEAMEGQRCGANEHLHCFNPEFLKEPDELVCA